MIGRQRCQTIKEAQGFLNVLTNSMNLALSFTNRIILAHDQRDLNNLVDRVMSA